MTEYADRVRGSLLGGALGDALGWPVEFLHLDDIREQYGPAGVTGRVNRRGWQVTDDTQMTLFSAEGMIRGFVRGWSGGGGSVPEAVHQAYQRWFLTQEQHGPAAQPVRPYDGWLLQQQFLYARRAPGNACMSGAGNHREFEAPAVFGQPGPVNAHSKGCGTVMRSAPFGLARLGVEQAFALAAQCGQLTHGHPTGYLAAGAFAALVERVTAGVELRAAVEQTIEQTAAWPGGEETVKALRRAVLLADQGNPDADWVERVGLGWIAEECLAVAVYCALAGGDGAEGARRALLLSVNHSGDSDSTGAVCGNLVGAVHGASLLPPEWVDAVEGRDVLLRVADDLVALFGGPQPDHAALGDRYPVA